MSQTEALRERLGNEYYFVSVEPAPVAGPFPQRAADSMSLSLTAGGGYSVRSPINSGSGGSFTLATDGDKTTITFGGAAWTERGLGRVSGDDANGTLKRRMEEAEDFLQARLSKAAGPYELELRDTQLVLKSQSDGAVLIFAPRD
ncbi:uncharacterized protein ACA1_388670 [Acanthamoeba castellanii str. Neff]|jgi:hypothetical protein|uniref:DUF306 domain-containing protein n=1 Tax=Acanthamoeba castellanii (strain ATCC 30010 / Neff) TaxID=1257118 RepID=L8GDS8_ACACF|nr:uncharacterized protein ACA1_388670 [Acanthamoeba castellanii str. Neff]ELR11177.1 hypothetical protein ACA1_388670 [Acanthamoeba castellanii str. Neff]